MAVVTEPEKFLLSMTGQCVLKEQMIAFFLWGGGGGGKLFWLISTALSTAMDL